MAQNRTTKKPTADDVLIKEDRSSMPLTRKNFILMAVAGLMIIIGFLLMAGGASTVDSFNDDIFSFRRIILGPGIAFIGFIFMGFAIMYQGHKESKSESAADSDTLKV